MHPLLLAFILACLIFPFNARAEDVLVPNAASGGELCEAEETATVIILTIPQAISRALNYNRPIVNTVDAKIKAEYAVILSQSDFEITITPNSKAGYVGGGRDGLGMSVGGGIDIGKQFECGTFVSVGSSLLKTPEHYHSNLKATVSQPLLRGLGAHYQLSALHGAKFNLRTACRNIFIARINLILQTVRLLYEIVKSEKIVAFNRESYARIKKFYLAAKLKENMGLGDGLDVYRAEIEYGQAEDHLKDSQEKLQETEDALRDLLALSPEICFKIEAPLVFTPNHVCEAEAIDTALKNRMEIEQAEDLRRENCRVSRIAKDNLYPNIDLVFDYSNCGKDEIFTRSCSRKRESIWGVGLTAAGEYNPAADRMAYRDSLTAVTSAERAIEQITSDIALEVRKSLRKLQRSLQKIETEKRQIKASRTQLALAEIKFNRGMGGNFDVIQAENTFRSSQISYWSAIIDHIVGEYQFLAALGLLTDKPCIQ